MANVKMKLISSTDGKHIDNITLPGKELPLKGDWVWDNKAGGRWLVHGRGFLPTGEVVVSVEPAPPVPDLP